MGKGARRIVAPKQRDLSKRPLSRRRSRKLLVAWTIMIVVFSVLAFAMTVPKVHVPWLQPDERAGSGSAIQSAPNVTSCFTPAEACASEIVEKIANSKSEIRVQAYGFTSEPIAAALVDARRRGIDVEVILDKSAESDIHYRHADADLVAHAGIPVFVDFQPAIAHNKVMIVDRHLVITGSYNFTASAERRNAENVTFIDSGEVARRFLSNWNSRKDASRTYVVRAP